MPPKKGGGDKPKSAKVAVDKTFGMKNKKGSKGQQAIALAQQQASQVGRTDEAKRKEREKQLKEGKKETEAARKAQQLELSRPVQVQQKVPFGTDPKTVLCLNFKSGYCERGAKCRFSHDPDVGRKVEKKDIYTDTRDDNKQETNENWTEEKLREVVAAKMGTEELPESNKGKDTQVRYDIVCKHFIDAIESNKYGWFWTCPGGGTECKYRHALPPGFVLRSQRKKDEEAEKAKEISMEEFLEVERHKLSKDKVLTPVTKESFAKWKATRMNKKEAEQDAMKKTKEAQMNAGKSTGMSGRDLFTFNPLLLEGDEMDSDDDDDDWDMEAWRLKAQRERDEAERIRMGVVEDAMAETSLDETETNGS